MRAAALATLLIGVAAAAAAGGFWLARQQPPLPAATSAQAPAPAPAEAGPRTVLYYRHPDGLPEYSATPKTDAAGRAYLPVHDDEEAALAPPPPPPPPPTSSTSTSTSTGGERKILYYRNPMGLPDTSPVPKRDQMGMDYIPVYADEAGTDAGIVRISPARVQLLGVRSAAAARRPPLRAVQAVGTVRFSEQQQRVVSLKVEGWIEALYVAADGEPVRRGQPMLRIYSPILVQTAEEYLDAAALAATLAATAAADADSGDAARRLAAGALQRLRNLDVPEAEIARLKRDGSVARTISWPAPVTGVVVDKTATVGMRFMPGEPLYRIAATSPVWVIAEVFEQDLGRVAVGQAATVTVKADPGRRFPGRVAYIYPTVAAETRTGRIRIELPNDAGTLKAGMYADVTLATGADRPAVLAVPESAVIDSGARQAVLIDLGDGRFEPRPVTVGGRSDGYTEIVSGLAEGERVVVSANFLIDAESNLRSALAAFTAGTPERR